MSKIWKVERLQARQYRATHVATGKQFEVRGKQGVHYWAAYEVQKDVVSKYIYHDNWQSKKLLLQELDEKLRADEIRAAERQKREEAKRKAWEEYLASKIIRQRIKPEVHQKIGKRKLNRNTWQIKVIETGQLFLLYNDGYHDGWRITFNSPEEDDFGDGTQPICIGMQDEKSALLELYYYLDVPLNPETRAQYREECFIER